MRRFIPTYVGNTSGSGVKKGIKTVHPHIRGEYVSCAGSRGFNGGSSPHTWGIRVHDAPTRDSCRFIPTYVGNTCGATTESTSPPVHPHIRGEYLLNICHTRQPDGSSPHTWGIRGSHSDPDAPAGFIPTYVGNTRITSRNSPPFSVHPHIRGEYYYPHFRIGIFTGSSPHTWGIRSNFDAALQSQRFIPTYVGNTEMVQSDALFQTVHPHIRGEY